MSRLNNYQRALVNALNYASARYLVIGGTAMRALGIDRDTADLDLLLSPSPENVKRITPILLARFKFNPGKSVEDMMRPGKMLRERGVDILSSVDGFNFDEAFGRSQRVRLDGCHIQVPTVDDQIALKQLSMETTEDRLSVYRDAHDIDLLQDLRRNQR